MIDLKSFKPQRHWTKPIFKRNEISLAAVARGLGVSYSYASAILSGNVKSTPEVEARLSQLANQLEPVQN